VAMAAAKLQPYIPNNPQNFRSAKHRSPVKGLLRPRFDGLQLCPISLPTTSVTRSWKNYLQEKTFSRGRPNEIVFLVVPAPTRGPRKSSCVGNLFVTRHARVRDSKHRSNKREPTVTINSGKFACYFPKSQEGRRS